MIYTFRCPHCGHVSTAEASQTLHLDGPQILTCTTCHEHARLTLRPLVEAPRSLAESLSVLLPGLFAGTLPQQSSEDVSSLLDTLLDAVKVVSADLARRQA